jgi:hypothetical protein
MPKYLIEASDTTEGVQGVIDKRGTARRAAVEQLAAEQVDAAAKMLPEYRPPGA